MITIVIVMALKMISRTYNCRKWGEVDPQSIPNLQ